MKQTENPSSNNSGTTYIISLDYTAEDTTNKDDNTELGLSNIKYPTQCAVKTYVDNKSYNAGGFPSQLGNENKYLKTDGTIVLQSLVDKTTISLENVDNSQQIPMSQIDNDTSLSSDSTNKIPTQYAIKTYIDAIIENYISNESGYIPYFDSTKSLSNTNIYFDSTNIGIDTTSPTYKLHIVGSGYFSTSLTIASLSGLLKASSGLISTATSGTDYIAGNIGTSGYIAKFSNVGVLANSSIYTDGTVIGIGTTSISIPLLATFYNSNSTGTSNDNAGILIRSVNRNAFLQFDSTSTSTGTGLGFSTGLTFKGFINYNFASNCITFGTSNNTEKMRLDSTGNLGINTTSPTYTIHVVGSSYFSNNTGSYISSFINPLTGGTSADNATVLIQSVNRNALIQIDSISTATSSIVFSAGGSEKGRIQYNNSSNYITISTNATERMRINDTGNVGIGATSPYSKLHIKSSFSGGGATLSIENASSTGDIAINFYQNSVFKTNFYYSNDGYIGINDSTNNLYLNKNGGNIGIGNGATSPTYKLHVVGTGYFSTSLTIASLSGLLKASSGLISVATLGSDYVAGGGSSNYIPYFSSTNTLANSNIYCDKTSIGINIIPGTGDGCAVYFDISTSSTGDVRLLRILQPRYNTRSATILFGNACSDYQSGIIGFIGNGSSTISNKISFSLYATNDLMVLTGQGYLGIKNTTPSYHLDVSGSGHFVNNVLIDGTVKLASLSGLLKASSGSVTTATSGTDYIAGNVGASGYIVEFSNVGVLANSSIYTDSTNIGIDTTSPSYKLHVVGTGYFSNTLTLGPTSGDAIYIAKPASYHGINIIDNSGGTTISKYCINMDINNITGTLSDFKGGMRISVNATNTTPSTLKLIGLGIGAHGPNVTGLYLQADGSASYGAYVYTTGTIGQYQVIGTSDGTCSTVGMHIVHQSTGNIINLYQQYSTMSGDFIYANAQNNGNGTFSGKFLDFNVNGSQRFVVDNAGSLTAAGSIATATGYLAPTNIAYYMGTSNQAGIYYDGTNVKINTRLSGSGEFEVIYGLKIDSTMTATGLGTGTGTDLVITSGNKIVASSSSRRYKTDITEIIFDTSKLNDLTAVTFKQNAETATPEVRDYGLIAEDVYEIQPELVEKKDGVIEGVKYKQLNIFMLMAVQKLQKEIEELKAIIASK